MPQRERQPPEIPPIRWPAPVLRITLRWDGSAWIIERTVRVESMTLPAPDELPAGEDSRGFWIEAVDRLGRVRHRQIMANPLAGMEQFGDKGLVTRVRHALDKPTIEVLVPALDDLAELHLVSNAAAHLPGHERPHAPMRTRLRLPANQAARHDGGRDPDHGDHRNARDADEAGHSGHDARGRK